MIGLIELFALMVLANAAVSIYRSRQETVQRQYLDEAKSQARAEIAAENEAAKALQCSAEAEKELDEMDLRNG